MAATEKRNITAVIQEYGKRLMGFIRRRVSIEADAEDILQDVFYQLAGNTEPIVQMNAWLHRVARNKITDLRRKQKPRLMEGLFEDGGEADGLQEWLGIMTGNEAGDRHQQNLFWTVLQRALDDLPEEQRLVFIMNEMEGIPFKEIAAITGEGVNTLLSRKRYAVLHLRQRLQWLREDLLEG